MNNNKTEGADKYVLISISELKAVLIEAFEESKMPTFTRDEAAKYLGISFEELQRLENAGELKPEYIRGFNRYTISRLRAYQAKAGR